MIPCPAFSEYGIWNMDGWTEEGAALDIGGLSVTTGFCLPCLL